MSDDQTPVRQGDRSWLERIGQALFGEPKDHDELLELLQSAQQRDILDSDALEMIEGVLEVSRMQTRDIMVPRSKMAVVDVDASLESLLPHVLGSGHSRFPVIAEDRDDVVGILLAKDLLGYAFNKKGEPFNVKDILRPATFVPESKRLNVLLREFRINRNHMAIVVDEYGGVAGLITIEDVLEEIVGEIEDEHDTDARDNLIKKISEDEYALKALTPIDEFNEYFEASFSDEEFDTIGGLVTHGFGHLPKRGEQIKIDDFQFTVQRADNRRIRALTVIMLKDSAAGSENP